MTEPLTPNVPLDGEETLLSSVAVIARLAENVLLQVLDNVSASPFATEYRNTSWSVTPVAVVFTEMSS